MGPLVLALWMEHSEPVADDARTRCQQLSQQVMAAFDRERGGFVSRSAVPFDEAVELSLQRAEDGAGKEWLDAAETTIRWTHGLMDTLTGGYVHGGAARDEGTSDKRADSNGRRLENLVSAWRLTGKDEYRRDGSRVVDWAERVLLDGRGGFVTAQIGDRELEPASNGVILHAWLAWASATRDPRRRDFALRSLDRVWETCWVEKLGLIRRNAMGDVDHEPLLLDQAEMGRAYVMAASLCGRVRDRERARALGALIVARFQESSGALRTQSMPNKNGSIRKARSVASENARAARFLCELSGLTGDASYRAAAARATGAFAKSLGKSGVEAAPWAMAARAAYAPDLPSPVSWLAEDRDEAPQARKRSVRFKLHH